MATYLRGRGIGEENSVVSRASRSSVGNVEMRRSPLPGPPPDHSQQPRRQQWQRWDDPVQVSTAKISLVTQEDDPYYSQTDSEDDEMSGPGLDWNAVQEIIGSSDDRFESMVNSLNMRELLDLVSGLQSAMAEEQQRFDDLRIRLDLLGPAHLDGGEGETLSVALCSSQMRLARLCARNMRCFTQQAVRAKQNHRLIAADADSRSSISSVDGVRTPKSSPDSEYPVVRRNSADRSRVEDEDQVVTIARDSPVRAVGFKERLRFFQQQEAASNNKSVPNENGSSTPARKTWSSSEEWVPAGDTSPPRGEATVLDEYEERSTVVGSLSTRDNSDALSDFRTRSESDFDVSDFVVHRTSFGDELDDAYDSCSAVEEESLVSGSTPTTSPVRIIKVEVEDRTPAPTDSGDAPIADQDDGQATPLTEHPTSDTDDDFVEQERELQKRQGVLVLDDVSAGDSEGGGAETEEDESEEDFVDNSATYIAADPRRYVYYTDENELEVIMEQPEEEAEAEQLLREQQALDDEEEDDEDTDSDARSSTVDSVVQRVVLPLSSTNRDNVDSHVTLSGGSSHSKTENGGLSSDDDSIKSPTSLGFKEENHDDSGVAEDHPSSSSAAEDLDEALSPTDAKRVNGIIVRGIDSPDPLPRLEENVFTSNLQVPLAPRPLPNYVPVNGYRQKTEIKSEDDPPPALPATPPPKRPLSPTKTVPPEIKPKTNGHVKYLSKDANEDENILPVRPRSTTLSWDPTDLLGELYKTPQINERSDCRNVSYPGEHPVMMEGYLEKLPTGKRKSTYWNSWKRRYFKVHDGHLHCFDSSYSEEPRMSILLMGGIIERLDDKVVGLDDRRGHYLVLRCHNEADMDDWFDVLSWHSQENFDATYVHPIAYPLPSRKKVVIIDLGGCSTRAGIMMDQPSLPQVYFPNVCASNKISHKKVYGIEALVPHVRQQSIVNFPIQPTAKITKYTLDVDALPLLFKKVFTELNMDPSSYTVALCVPRTLSPQTQIAITRILLEEFGAFGVNMTHQALLTLYAYRSTSGVVVDIGDRLDIVPVSEGYIVENGITRLPYGGRRIAHHLNHTLAHKQISLVSDVESFLLRYLLEQSCYVAQNYDEEVERCRNDPESVEKVVSVKQFFHDNTPPFKEVTMEFGRFHAPEGLFNPKLWGLDSPGLAKLVHKAIQECGMDVRREMARSIFLSGGVTCLPGFAQRLEKELDKLTPNSVTPKVHASPYRQHMAFLGACQMSLSNEFQRVCITREEWMTSSNNQRTSLINRWHL